MSTKSEPWYIHAILLVIIAVLVVLLIQVSIVEPGRIVKLQKYHKTESRARMANLREAQILWQEQFGKFTDNLDSLIEFVKFDTNVAKIRTGIDTITGKPSDPFTALAHGEFSADSLFLSPRSYQRFIFEVDTTIISDTVIDRRGRIRGIDTTITIGTRYLIQSPDSDDRVGDVDNDALKNTASWE